MVDWLPLLVVLCLVINVEKLDVPACAPISWLSLLSYWIVVEQYVLHHTFNCHSLLITLTICRICLALLLNFAWHSISILHKYFLFKLLIFSWKQGDHLLYCVLCKWEVCKPRISSRKRKLLNITIWSKVVLEQIRQMFSPHFSNNLCTTASLVDNKPHFLQPCQIFCTVSWE